MNNMSNSDLISGNIKAECENGDLTSKHMVEAVLVLLRVDLRARERLLECCKEELLFKFSFNIGFSFSPNFSGK